MLVALNFAALLLLQVSSLHHRASNRAHFIFPLPLLLGGNCTGFSSCLVNDLKASDSKYLDKSWCSAFHPALDAQTEALLH